jgi:hypothetical protein
MRHLGVRITCAGKWNGFFDLAHCAAIAAAAPAITVALVRFAIRTARRLVRKQRACVASSAQPISTSRA